MARTIPEPTETDFSMALTAAISLWKENHDYPLTYEDLDYLTKSSHVVAQLNAEVRWLRNLVHGCAHEY